MSDQGLTQDDFRKLLQTPRAPSGDGDAPRSSGFKAPPPKTPRNVGATFAKPQSLKRKKYGSESKRKEGDEEEEEEEHEKSVDVNYRDRAAERRKEEGSGEVTTDGILQQLSEDGQELDPKAIYDQSKYLGGDTEHTHLVKGLDYSLLERVRREMRGEKDGNEVEEEAEDELDHALISSKIDQNEGDLATNNVGSEEKEDEVTVEDEIKSPFARRIYEKAVVDASKEKPLKNELFTAGRMAFVFELADDRGHYSSAFGIPTSIIRSKADIMHRGSRSSTDDLDADAQFVIGKVVQVIQSFKNGTNKVEVEPAPPPAKKFKREPSPQKIVAMDDDDDIFADAGREYELDEDEDDHIMEENKEQNPKAGKYFEGIAKDDMEEDEPEESEEQRKQNIAKILAASAAIHDTESKDEEKEKKQKESKFSDMQVDTDADDYNMFGLSAEALPSSFEDLKKSMAYDEGFEDSDGQRIPSSLIDAGTHRNKKAQLTRWDFDDEEDWQRYKDNLEVLPKSAMQYGVKMSEGRKRNREQRNPPNEKQKLDREWQKLKSFMDKKRDE
ncbi:hypothetical protein INT43_008411 [Umbelopsis isabellina]|uniref:Protein Red n=1 Tax=Mortierella isabellina TaxID=91625 RepID=A0A8H7UGI4_MORIS|nr:hypothetical protein INT43_008411 [Umbelopsis isabellina]